MLLRAFWHGGYTARRTSSFDVAARRYAFTPNVLLVVRLPPRRIRGVDAVMPAGHRAIIAAMLGPKKQADTLGFLAAATDRLPISSLILPPDDMMPVALSWMGIDLLTRQYADYAAAP